MGCTRERQRAHAHAAFSDDGDWIVETGIVAFASRALICTLIWLLAVAQLSPNFELRYSIPLASLHYEQQYSLFTGLHELWNRGAAWLAGVLFFWSGAWPHFKLILLIVANCLFGATPSSRTGPLSWLAWLGRWSLVDVFTSLLLSRFFSIPFASCLAPLPCFPAGSVEFRLLPGVLYIAIALSLSQAVSLLVFRRNRHLADVLALRELRRDGGGDGVNDEQVCFSQSSSLLHR